MPPILRSNSNGSEAMMTQTNSHHLPPRNHAWSSPRRKQQQPQQFPPSTTRTSGSVGSFQRLGDSSDNESSNGTASRPIRSVVLPGGSTNAQTATSSVEGEHPLTRDDLSDLSGSYLNGNTTPRRAHYQHQHSEWGQHSNTNHHHHTNSNNNNNSSHASVTSYQRPWRQAQILSARSPTHPQPRLNEDEDSVHKSNIVLQDMLGVVEIDDRNFSSPQRQPEKQQQQQRNNHGSNNNNNLPSLEQVSPNSSGSSIGYNNNHTTNSSSPTSVRNIHSVNNITNYNRLPILLLLMDPGRKMYELMQIWVDASVDTVRDVLQTLQTGLPVDQWRQDYDGLLQVVHTNNNNNNNDSNTANNSTGSSSSSSLELQQLIHVLPISNYQVQPHQVWVAKPWAMSAKATVPYAQYVVQHLQGLGVLQFYKSNASSPSRNSSSNNSNGTKQVLGITKDAQSRIYVPEGILRHYHACQFLSFCPPFEKPNHQHQHQHPSNNRFVSQQQLQQPSSAPPSSQLQHHLNGNNPVRVDVLAVESDDASSSVSCSMRSSSIAGSSHNFSASTNSQQHRHATRQQPHSVVSSMAGDSSLPSRTSSSRVTPPPPPPQSLAARADESMDTDSGEGNGRAGNHHRRRSLGSLLCNLNCQKQRHKALHQQNDLYDSTFSPTESTFDTRILWKVYEDESMCGSAVSDSSRMPLISRGHRRSATMADF